MSDRTILLVDDNLICSLDIGQTLREATFTVVMTHCALEALELVAQGSRLSGLVTDIDLGPGPDGFEVARRARESHPELPVVYISGTAAARHPLEGVPDSVFLAKPCPSHEIVAALNRAIRLQAA